MIERAALIVPDQALTQLRPADAGDEPFVKRLFKTVRAGDFAAAGLPEAALDMLLEQQYRAQATGYAARFPDATSFIILHQDEAVGRLLLLVGDARWHIIDVGLIPAWRGRGIGTDVIEATARAAKDRGAREITLHVLFNNAAARRLYGRLGFAETGDGVHVPMVKTL